MKRYFITGTDTDCGKTYVTCMLLAYLNQKYKAQAIKPIASGCEEVKGQLVSQDVVRLQAYNADENTSINYWKYKEPIAPHLAAHLVNEEVTATQVMQFCEQTKFNYFDYLLIEGAGGLLVPLNNHETWLDFLKLFNIPVILVVGMRLGCINHALLTDALLKAHQVPCLGWIANDVSKEMLFREENISTLKAMMHMPFIGRVYYDALNHFNIEFDNNLLI
ncbi:dethiobiotin synthase [Legionella sp. D16C41]|uniref:dethiobiotin synthase n=1 Tax=Legionella sp. D16C41 TaxID=3402688 RepID=UPI003AF73566